MSDDKLNRGALWENRNKRTDAHPDLSGQINIEGVEYWISGWLKGDESSESAPVVSLSVRPMKDQAKDPRFKGSLVNPGAAIRAAQHLKGLTNLKMAEDYGVARQQINRWTHAEDMYLSKLREFAAYFNLPLVELLELGVPPDQVNSRGQRVELDSRVVNVGASIRAALKLKRKRSADMAREMDVTRQQASRWTSSEDMLLSKAVGFADYFDLDFCEFLKLGTTD